MPLDLPIADVTLQLAILLAAALAVQLTLERIHLPGIVGLLLVGMLLGPGGLQLLPAEPAVEILGSVGLLYIMFLAGLEIDLDVAAAQRTPVLAFGLSAFLLSLVPAVGLGFALGTGVAGAILLGAALSSHTLLAYPIVERLELTDRRAVVTAIGGTLVTDTLALVLLVLTTQLLLAGEPVMTALLPLAGLAALVALSLLLLPRLARRFLTGEAGLPVKALFVLFVLLLLAALADLLGTEDILGAFLAGLCLNRVVRERPALHEHVAFVGRMLFIPFFFLHTGMRLELQVFFGSGTTWGTAALLLGAVVLGKSAATLLVGVRYGYGWEERLTMVGLTVPQAAATLAVTVIGTRAGAFDAGMVDAIILVIFLSCLAGPLLTHAVAPRLADGEADAPRRPRGTGPARREHP